MATYQEIRELFRNSDLQEKMEAAAIIAANTLAEGTPTSAENAYIADVYTNPKSESLKLLMGVLAKNASLTPAQILSATDEALQAQVDLIVPILVNAKAGV